MAVVADELSTLSPVAADTAASGVRGAASALSDVADQVASARADLGGWRGVAEAGFADRVVELEDHLKLLTWTAAAGAGAIEEYSRELGILQGRIHVIDTSLEDAARRLANPALELAAFASAWAEQERWQGSRSVVLAQFDDAADQLADCLQALVRDIPHRPRSLGEHVTDGLDVVADQVRSTAYLTAGWAWDREGWQRTWRQMPAALREEVEDPVGTAADAVQWDDITAGRWGAVGGGLAAAVIGGGLGKAIEDVVPDLPHTGDRDRPRGPNGRFLPQSFDEMLAGVDLVRNDDHPGAHTVARHVAVDDAFLEQRLRTGGADGVRPRRAPDIVSRWSDLTTAEHVITRALRAHESEVRAWMSGTRKPSLALTDPVAPSSGVAWTLVDGRPTMLTVSTSQIVLMRAEDGTVVVKTAYLEP